MTFGFLGKSKFCGLAYIAFKSGYDKRKSNPSLNNFEPRHQFNVPQLNYSDPAEQMDKKSALANLFNKKIKFSIK